MEQKLRGRDPNVYLSKWRGRVLLASSLALHSAFAYFYRVYRVAGTIRMVAGRRSVARREQ